MSAKRVLNQVREFSKLVEPLGVKVAFREAIDHWTVFAQLERSVRDAVLDVQYKVSENHGDLGFELILVYPEDMKRQGMQELLRLATAV